ncbi:hypothetical protein PGTUg99_020505 [Puccinia graminis f. sp. tritici]|uniref:Uncharacterized protein n=1 Tax=Puccinia graminis f. sp. tritici TaxID=56615 RepID=A0A5B0M9R1_PUCGR|nr:hypothetical protein PGTUg99_020505 [Puccinia graminis f. sp. tritici]
MYLLGDPLYARRGRFLLSRQLHGVVGPIHPAGPSSERHALDSVKPTPVIKREATFSQWPPPAIDTKGMFSR